MDNRGWGRFKIFHQKFSVSHCRKTPYGNFSVLCFRIFPVVERILSKRARSFKFFCRIFFCLTKPKIPLGECFTVAIISGIEKLWLKEGKYQDCPSKSFCLTVQKIFVGEPFSVSLFSGIEKFYAYEVNIKIFYRKFVVSQCRKVS